ncbi:MAG: TIM-barrel domain-containing protein [Thermomicrobiales bacterium]
MPDLKIIHQPTGIDHPYEPLFQERRPRDPSAGDMVVLGFLSKPGQAVETVRVDWTRNDRPQTPIFARAIQRGTDEDRWLVELGVMEAGDRVSYSLSATAADGRHAGTPAYEFTTRSWFFAAPSQIAIGDGLRMVIGGERDADGRGEIYLQDSGDASRAVSVRLQYEGTRIVAVELTAPLVDDERLVGFGERFDAVDQRGRALDIAVYEQYKNQGNRTYLPVPLLISSSGYGLLVEGTTHVEFDLGRTVPDRWRCLIDSPPSGEVALRFFTGLPDDIVREFTALTGRPEPMPEWAYGLWMSANEWNTQARVEHEVAQTIAHDIPSTVLVIEAWSDETTFYIWNGAEYQPRPGLDRPSLADFTFPADGPWPDPTGMIEDLRAKGIRTVLWQIPALKDAEEAHPQHDSDVEHAVTARFVLENGDGSPYRNPFFWFKNALIPDFSNRQATDWWMNKRAYLLDEMGIDGFKTDGSEHLAGRDLRATNGMHGDELVNAYPNLYVSAYHQFAKDRRKGDALTFSRAGHTGAGAFHAHWAGDENSTWESYRRSIVAGLTAGLSGVIFWGWDIAGFSEDLPSVELYLRAAAMAAFCPIMQYHSEYNAGGPPKDRTPWNIARHHNDDRAIELFRHFVQARTALLPYLVQEGAYAAAEGTPLMRPLLLDHPDDPIAWTIQDQYRFGRSLLVAPVVEEGATMRRLYLPDGVWTDYWTGETYPGGDWIEFNAPLDSIPVFVLAGHEIPS